MMIRAGDRVQHTWHKWISTATDVVDGSVTTGSGLCCPDDDLLIVCCQCSELASRFATGSGTAYCEACAPEECQDVRPDPSAIVSCICGESLDASTDAATWLSGEIACEYRTCLHCHSTRAYAPADVVRGRLVALYAVPDTSEVSEEWGSFLDALMSVPPTPTSELRRNGVLLARAFAPITCSSLGWRVMPPEKESAI